VFRPGDNIAPENHFGKSILCMAKVLLYRPLQPVQAFLRVSLKAFTFAYSGERDRSFQGS
jgi:hypothetical protein